MLARVLALEHHAAHVVDRRALLVHHVVVLEQVLAHAEVLRLDLLLRALDRARHHAVLDRNALFHAEPQHQAADALGAEDPHQVVLQRQVEARRAGVALAAGAAAQLVVDAARLVALGAEDVQAAERHHALALVLVEQRLHPRELRARARPARARLHGWTARKSTGSRSRGRRPWRSSPWSRAAGRGRRPGSARARRPRARARAPRPPTGGRRRTRPSGRRSGAPAVAALGLGLALLQLAA